MNEMNENTILKRLSSYSYPPTDIFNRLCASTPLKPSPSHIFSLVNRVCIM